MSYESTTYPDTIPLLEVRLLKTEHAETAHEFLSAAYREFALGDMLQASEKMWGAAVHAIEAVAQERGWEYGSHYKLLEASDRLSEELDDTRITAGMVAARAFHANFYHGFMEESEFSRGARLVEALVDRVVETLGDD